MTDLRTAQLRFGRRESDRHRMSIGVLGGFVAGIIVGMMIAGYALTNGGQKSMSQAKFDYESCQVIVAPSNMLTNPGVPDHWKEMVHTPGGNWCIR